MIWFPRWFLGKITVGLWVVCGNFLLVGRPRWKGGASALTLVMASFKIEGEGLVKGE